MAIATFTENPLDVVNFPAAGPTPFEIVLSRRGESLTVTFLGSLSAAAAQVLDDVLIRLTREFGPGVTLDLSASLG